MRYLVLATDYDGTLAHHGSVSPETLAAMVKLRESGRRLVLVTGREMADLATVFGHFELFDYIVAENGATLYNPATREEKPLCEQPPDEFVQALVDRGVPRLSRGRVIVATWQPHETVVLQTIRDLGLELQVIFNKGAVMILPSGVNKATGLKAALKTLGLSQHNAVAVGDAENDHALLSYAEAGVAVANALPMLKQRADWVTTGVASEGVTELIERLIASDLSELEPGLARHHLLVGHDAAGAPITLPGYGSNLLVTGPTEHTKPATVDLLQRLIRQSYQTCVLDPIGDMDALDKKTATVIGSRQQPPETEQVLEQLQDPKHSAVVNLRMVPRDDRLNAAKETLRELVGLRERVGRPHWIAIEEAQHVLAAVRQLSDLGLQELDRLLLVVPENVDQLARPVLERVDSLLALGPQAERQLGEFAAAARWPYVGAAGIPVAAGEAFFWRRGSTPIKITLARPAE